MSQSPSDRPDRAGADVTRPNLSRLPTPSGYVDNLLATPDGDLVLVGCKLWRNPEALREVVGQTLDYAKELSAWRRTVASPYHAIRRCTPCSDIEHGVQTAVDADQRRYLANRKQSPIDVGASAAP